MTEIRTDALFIPEGIGLISSLVSTAGFTSMTIKASPEIMEAKASDVTNAIDQIRQEFEEMSRAMDRTAGYWNGEAAELHRRRYAGMKPQMESMLRCLKEHADNLQEIAAIYTTTQAKVTAITQALPIDAIE